MRKRFGLGRRAGALIAAAAAVGAAALPAQARTGGGSTAPSYAFDPAAQRVRGAVTSSDAVPLTAGRTYRDTLAKDGKVYYRLDLDDRQNAYVSVVAVPGPGSAVKAGDGFKVVVRDGSGTDCDSQRVGFGSSDYARPLVGYAHRATGPGGASGCRRAGTFYVLVERDSPDSRDDWELELRYLTEPPLKEAGPTRLPETWSSGTPAPPTGGPRPRQGGAGFHGAVPLTRGEWRSDIRPGESLFYRVPLDWGQQLFTTAELGSSTKDGGYVSGALSLTLVNPAFGQVAEGGVGYSGKPATLPLGPQRPVAHENRVSFHSATKGMRFAGWYYLVATLDPEVAEEYGGEPVPLTLRVNVLNAPKPGPGYDGDAGPFAVTAEDRAAAETGVGGSQAAEGTARADSLRLVAVAGIGTGTVLLAGLGAWTAVARRRAA
ncbi:hypothetical protein [Streptomyces sp. NPDC001744]|uniref:hypothetical protein n=1 Tax=Streptomyces sp. NPDC001744 TaxID=3364606 RepID=UPI0036891F12